MMCQSANAMWSRWSAMLVWMFLLLCCSANVVSTIIYQVTEEQPPNTLIGSLASDQGLPDTGHLYKLEVGAPYLRVDGKTGDIYTTETPIDRETLKDCRNLFEGDPCFLEFEVSITDLMKGTGPSAHRRPHRDLGWERTTLHSSLHPSWHCRSQRTRTWVRFRNTCGHRQGFREQWHRRLRANDRPWSYQPFQPAGGARLRWEIATTHCIGKPG